MPAATQALDSRRQRADTVWIAALFLLLAVGVVALIRYFGLLGLYLIVPAIGGVALVLAHPLTAFSLYLGSLLLRDPSIPGMPLALNQALALVFFASAAWHWARGQSLRLPGKPLLLLGVLAALFTVSGLLALDPERGPLHARYVVIYFAMAVALASVLRSDRAVMALAWVVVGVTLVSTGIGIVEAVQKNIFGAFGGRWTDAVRVRGTAPNAIVFAWAQIFGSVFAFFLYAVHRSEAARWTALVAGMAALGIALFTFNRQTILLIGLIVPLMAFMFRYRNRATLLGILGIAGSVAAVTILPLLIERLLTVRNLTADFSYLTRRDSWLVGWQMIEAHPWFGVGLGAFPGVWKEFIPPDYSTFNLHYMPRNFLQYPDLGYFQILCEVGAVGLAAYVAFQVWVGRRLWVLRREAARTGDSFAHSYLTLAWVLFIMVVLTTATQDTFLYVRVWILYALVLVADRRVLLGGDENAAAAESGT